MAKNLDGVLVKIEAQHDFNTVVASRVFVPGDRMEIATWIDYVVSVKKEQARLKDPSFEFYAWGSTEESIIVQITDTEEV
ncbi:hypothetical protein STASHLEY_00550 [Brevundimonas phage vB_BpoS-StAshley]|nr:hypothetical protein STASHLEY_00550 [Brevundimonas phage vB_BpoS-StAshley]